MRDSHYKLEIHIYSTLFGLTAFSLSPLKILKIPTFVNCFFLLLNLVIYFLNSSVIIL